jgi:hypothetical protein
MHVKNGGSVLSQVVALVCNILYSICAFPDFNIEVLMAHDSTNVLFRKRHSFLHWQKRSHVMCVMDTGNTGCGTNGIDYTKSYFDVYDLIYSNDYYFSTTKCHSKRTSPG